MLECCKENEKIIINTPNLNFLRLAHSHKEFYDCLLSSDILIADGMPIIWISKLLSIPISERIAGSTILTKIVSEIKQFPLKVFYFGGQKGIAKKAHKVTNKIKSSTKSIGYLYPDFGSVEQLSSEKNLKYINNLKPNIILVSLPADKGVRWIGKNIHKVSFNIAICSGTTINFIAGELKRAPIFFQKNGFEWLWRIKEEPRLIKRYFYDFLWLCSHLFLKLIPLCIIINLHELFKSNEKEEDCINVNGLLTLPKNCENHTASYLRNTSLESLELNNSSGVPTKEAILDAKKVRYANSRFVGELLLLKVRIKKSNITLKIINKSFNFNLLLHLMGAKNYLNDS